MPDQTPSDPAEPRPAPTDPKTESGPARDIDSDPGLSPVAEQPGGAALANIGKPNGSDLFRE